MEKNKEKEGKRRKKEGKNHPGTKKNLMVRIIGVSSKVDATAS